MVDIKMKVENYERQLIIVKNRLEMSRKLLIDNINYYNSDEIKQLNDFFGSIDLLLEEESNNFNGNSEFMKYLRLNKYTELLKAIEESLDMFENDLNLKKKENIKK